MPVSGFGAVTTEKELENRPRTACTIDVAVCTFRRPSLVETLQSIARQDLSASATVRVIVADNDEAPSAEGLARDAAARLGLDLRYVHAPRRNISVARNACLDHATAPLLAFIDDDEVASPGWLRALVARMEETGADAVLGPVTARYPDDAPAWVRHADLHSTRPPVTKAGAIRTGYAGNVLLRRASFGGRRFDLDLGRTGGEDDAFFAAAVRDGAVIAYAPQALVDEPVAAARVTLAWLSRRSFRNGQTYARNQLEGGASRAAALALALGKAGLCLAGAALCAWSAVRWRRLLVRGMLHLGASAGLLGRRDLQLY